MYKKKWNIEKGIPFKVALALGFYSQLRMKCEREAGKMLQMELNC